MKKDRSLPNRYAGTDKEGVRSVASTGAYTRVSGMQRISKCMTNIVPTDPEVGKLIFPEKKRGPREERFIFTEKHNSESRVTSCTTHATPLPCSFALSCMALMKNKH